MDGPVNAYGSSKLEFEKAIIRAWRSHVILRSSNILGPPACYNGSTKFLQWLDAKLQPPPPPPPPPPSMTSGDGDGDGSSGPLTLFEDEIRSFVSVNDIARAICQIAIRWCMKDPSTAAFQNGIRFNAGGPDSLSRVALAAKLAAAKGYKIHITAATAAAAPDKSPAGAGAPPCTTVVPTSRQALDGEMGYRSPVDITMDSSGLGTWLGWTFTEALRGCAER